MEIKYVVIDKLFTFGNIQTIFIFPGWVDHKEFCDLNANEGEKILSAGFVDLNTKSCYGKSSSLGISANPKQDDIFLSIMYDK